MALTPGTKLGPYDIQSSLGAGGMGEVYRATDTKLSRDVALKILPAEMARDPERLGRFRREAKCLAQLDHPNIVTIYSVEECDGIHFLTMQLVEGQPLDRLIPKGGLPLEQIVEIASALGDALAAAHEKGIVHRDLKPANVMVSNDGRVKVLDFGLAKDIRAANLSDATMTSASRTEVGVVMGTPAYMSPEQTSGRPLDHRTDIFSMGVLLHEMATGQRPFNGDSPAELVSAILRDNPPAVTDARPDLPIDLTRIVRRCLEKDPRHRVQTARDVNNEFRDLARQSSPQGSAQSAAGKAPATLTAPASVAPDSGTARGDEGFWVAVLPFKYKGSDSGLEALTEALSEEVITGLSRFSYLRVIARGSTLRFANQFADLRAVGKELGARYVLDGTLRQAGPKLRLAVQLVDAITGAHLWAENYERTFSPEAVFELQDDLVPRIVSTVADMNGALPRSMAEAVRSRAPEQLSPYEAVLRSFAYFERYTPEELSASRSGLEAAVRKAPAYADAWAMLSCLCAQDYVHGYELQPNALDVAASAARHAVELSPANHLAYFSLAQVLSYQKDFDSFRHAAERAVALNPMDGNSVALLGELLTYAGNAKRGMQLAERAKQLNPNHPGSYWYADFYHAFSQGDYRSALAFALKVKLRGNPLASMFIATAAGHLGERETAAKAAADLLKFRPELPALMGGQVAKIWNPEYGERFLEGLRKAGIAIPEAGASAGQKISTQPTSLTLRTEAVPDSGATRADEGFWVAVLPFKYAGTTAELKALADGLSEEIVTGLSRFSYLRVIARGSTAKYSSESGDIRAIGKELGARYVMEGSIRQAGAKARIAVQLVDANAGSSLWAETYDRPFAPEDSLDVLDDVVPRIVATIGDAQGILAHSMTEALRNRDPESLTPYEALLRSFGFHQHVSEDEHLAGITALESAVKKAPDHADCWAMLSWLYRAEYTHGYHARPDSMDRSLTAARRAVNLAPSSQLAHAALASAHFFRGELGEFRAAAERALALNRMQGYTTAFLGLHFAYSGDWERGCALAERATQLNPNHPGWYWLPLVINAYRQHDGERALQHALKINMPGLWTAQVALTVVNSQLGKMDQARSALRALLAVRPDFAARAQEDLSIWWQPELVEQMLGDLRKAGVTPSRAAVLPRTSSVIAPAQTASGESRADEGFWVAVLPFKYAGTSAELKALADGLSEEVITGLSRFSYLRVIARGSTAKYSSESSDIRAIGKELGARYVMEGSIRQAGTRVRFAVQLVDSTTGAHLWAETYERAFIAEAVFELQDELVPRIVSTVADMNGMLSRSMSEAVRSRDPEQLNPYEAVLRSFGYFERVTPEDLAAARTGLEAAVRNVPAYADAWAMLALLHVQDYAQGFDLQTDALTSGTTAARRAVAVAPSNHLAHFSLAQALFFQKEFPSFRNAAARAVELNPMDGNSLALLGEFLVHAGDSARGLALAERAKQLNPNHPGWYWHANFTHAYREGDFRGALSFALKSNMTDNWGRHALIAAAHGQLGEREEAGKALRDLLRLRPDVGATIQREAEKWFDPEYGARIIEGLRKAGLEIGRKTETVAVKAPDSGAARADEGFWVAVLPFRETSGDADLEALADGLTEDVTTGLSQFPYLQVMAHNSAMAYKGRAADIRRVGRELGARYVIEGSIRKRGRAIRVSAQLMDAVSGTQLWAEAYDREISDAGTFQVQDDLTDHIVTTVADGYGVLVRSMAAPTRDRKVEELSASELVLRYYAFMQQIDPQEHAVLRAGFERALEREPNYATAWACLSNLYQLEYFDRFNPREKPLERAREAAWQAVKTDPACQMGWKELAAVHFFSRDFTAFRQTAERAVSLNPRDGTTLAFMAIMIAFSGDWERGVALAQRAIDLNRHHPGWYHNVFFHHHYRKGEYEAALQAAKKINMPEFHWMHLMTAAACGMLGRLEEARTAIESLRKHNPTFLDLENVREDIEMWDPDKGEVEQFLQGLQKAGLKYGSAGSM